MLGLTVRFPCWSLARARRLLATHARARACVAPCSASEHHARRLLETSTRELTAKAVRFACSAVVGQRHARRSEHPASGGLARTAVVFAAWWWRA